MSEVCSVMATKRPHCALDDAQSSNENENHKRQRKNTKNNTKNTKNMKNSPVPYEIMCSVRDEEVIKKERNNVFTAGAEFREYEKRTNEIFLKNMKAMAEERLRRGCGMPSDGLLLHSVEPCVVLEFLGVQEMEYLRRDVKVYLDLDRETRARVCYWEALLVVCEWEIGEARKREALLRGEQPSVELVSQERRLQARVQELLRGERHGEIELIQAKIELEIMRSGRANDVDYWKPVLQGVQVCKAKAFLEEFYGRIEALQVEETGDNFEMMSCLESNHSEERKKTHYDMIMDYYCCD